MVHIHNLWQFPQYAAYRAAVGRRVPYVVSPHGGLDPYLRQRGRGRKRVMTALWQGRMLDAASAIHVTTEAERDLVADVAPQVPRAIVPVASTSTSSRARPTRSCFATSGSAATAVR